ncbi:MAG TPA: hypothetical protein VGN63_03985 [Flavisolibacter sp.]|jgi:hypothetical protein|nr:hypothetical protein [Flavisolibacter sp.]
MDKKAAAIRDTLKRFGNASFVFVDTYKFHLTDERQMMQQTMVDIDSCYFLIAETFVKEIGVGIEADYAKDKGQNYILCKAKRHRTFNNRF